MKSQAAPAGQGELIRKIGPALLARRDCLAGMSELGDQSFDLAIADPPYGVYSSADWNLDAGHDLKGFGGGWKLASHQWDRLRGLAGLEFTLIWLAELKRLVRPSGSLWIHATYHNSGIVNVACQMLGLEIINEVVWFKRNAFPNLAGRRLTASHETVLWVHTGGKRRDYRFNYQAAKMASFAGDRLKQPDKQLRTVWDIPNNKQPDELAWGRHPTQKPLRLVERLLLISGKPGGSLLVPFMGSGSEMVAALRHGMEPTGFEIDAEMFALSIKRTEAEHQRLQELP